MRFLRNQSFTSLVAGMMTLLTVACGSKSGLGDGGLKPGTGGAAGASQPASTGGNGGNPGTGGASPPVGTGGTLGSGGSRGSGGQSGASTSDPCGGSYCEWFGISQPYKKYCIQGLPDSMLGKVSASCEDVCRAKCCSGPVSPSKLGAVHCPNGQLCAYPTANEGTTEFAPTCVLADQTCGGPDDTPCPDGQYCEQFGALCSGPPSFDCFGVQSSCNYAKNGGVGMCRMNPPDSQCGPETTPQCGCDGVTYPSVCARIAAKVAYDHWGACK